MNHSASQLTLVATAFSAALVCSMSEIQAEVRRGLLYDIAHFGKGCDPSYGFSPCLGVHGWLDGQMEAEKAKIREHLRTYRMQFYLHNQDHKKLLHAECNPWQDCYWGYYPTCWRQFPGRPCCPGPVADSLYYEGDPYGFPAEGMAPDAFEGSPVPGGADSDSLNLAPPAPEATQQAPAAPSYFE